MRLVIDSARSRGSLAVDPKTLHGETFPERVHAWDEDATTLAIDAARALASAPLAFVGPGIDLDTVRVALDLTTIHLATDPLGMARQATGPAFAIGCPDATSAIAALVDDGEGPEPGSPREISPPPRMVTAHRALQESGRIPPTEDIPDVPMGAYVPPGTWAEDLPARLRLLAQRCTTCACIQYPPRGACLACTGRTFDEVALPKTANVYTATRIGRGGAPSEFALEQAQTGAFWVAVVDWPEQKVRVTARLSGYDEDGPTLGAPVHAIVRKLFTQQGIVRYGVKFRKE